jgi:hypothetical protein
MFETNKRVKIKSKVEYTNYVWGDIKEIEDATLKLIEQNKQGDCMCYCGKGLVDVDHRDIERVYEDRKQGINLFWGSVYGRKTT